MKIRQQAEREIVRATVEAAITHGFQLDGVNNGEDDVDVSTVDAAMEHAFECDEARVYFRESGGGMAWLYIVLGNEGWTVISDYTTNLENAVRNTDALVKRWELLLSE